MAELGLVARVKRRRRGLTQRLEGCLTVARTGRARCRAMRLHVSGRSYV